MTEISSSQELPLSQETFLSIWNGIPPELREELTNGNFKENLPFAQFVEENPIVPFDPELIKLAVEGIQIHDTVNAIRHSSLPSTEDFPGMFDFLVKPPISENTTKASPFVYSTLTKRLYIRKDSVCPFNFSSNLSSSTINQKSFAIRAIVYFSSPENIANVVGRCINHSHADKDQGDPHFQHIMQCESHAAKYFQDSITKRFSVLVPFENPPMGQLYSTYLYKFTCYTSCSGGPNRRPICVVFTLEKDGMIVGRSKIELKICSSPYRDKLADEKHHLNPIKVPEWVDTPVIPSLSKYKKTTSDSSISSNKRTSEKSDNCFTIKVEDEDLYKLLRCVKKYYELVKHMKEKCEWVSTGKEITNLLKMLSSSDDEKI